MKLVRLAISAEAYGHDVTSKSSNDTDVTQSQQIFALQVSILFKLDHTFICNTYYLHLAKYTH